MKSLNKITGLSTFNRLQELIIFNSLPNENSPFMRTRFKTSQESESSAPQS